MNISTIIADITADPTILNDVQAYLDANNAENISQIVQAPVVVQQAVTQMTSRSKMDNGQPVTAADVAAAQAIIAAQPHIETTDQLADALRSAFASGDKPTMIGTLQQVIVACNNTIAQLGGP